MSRALEAVYLREDLRGELTPEHLLDWGRDVSGEVVRAVPGRRTLRVSLGGRSFYLKYHEGVGVMEVAKNWLAFKRPVLGAGNEFDACRHLRACGMVAPDVAAFATEGGFPPARRSLLLTEALDGYVDLERLSLRWNEQPPDPLVLRRLVEQVAAAARAMHGAGVAHRDFYVCHLLCPAADPQGPLGVLDLHRALIFDEVPERWRLKDLAALLFSVLDLPLSRRAWLRFVRIYTGIPLRRALAEQGDFWRRVHLRALKLHAKAVRKNLVRVS
ncbi:MAG: lipopolysaccharide core heptose(I) kinase RfaP [Myxococcales bacterium]